MYPYFQKKAQYFNCVSIPLVNTLLFNLYVLNSSIKKNARAV